MARHHDPAPSPDDLLEKTYTIVQLALIKDIGDSCHRLRWPARQLAAQASNWRVINLASNAEERYAWAEKADLLVISQSRDMDLLPVIARRRARGLKTLAEYNDNFYDPPPSSNVADVWQSPVIHQCYERIMNACDGIIVTGPGLRQLFGGKTERPIHILENHHPQPLPAFETVWREPGQTFAIGWGGSSGHIADFLSITPLLRDLARQRPNLRLHIMGDAPLAHFAHLDESRLVFREWGTMDEYFDFLRSLNLGLAPLIDTEFNRCRSDIKAIEMGSQGVLPLLPDRLPYQKVLSETGMTPYRCHRELGEKILFYMDNPGMLKHHARRLYDYIRHHRVGPRRRERLRLYSAMLPPQPQDAKWDLPTGYHEIIGTPARNTPTSRILQQAGNLVDRREPGRALALLREAVETNPRHADLALAEVKLLAMEGDPAWRERLQYARRNFPGDLRFDLLELRHARTPGDHIPLWKKLLARLQRETPPARRLYAAEVSGLLLEQLRRAPELLETAVSALDLYPAAWSLKHEVALHLERRGEDTMALQYFKELLAARKCHERNHKFLSGTTYAWLHTWLNTLTERLEDNT